MNKVASPAPMTITTLQGIEKYADETGQDFFDLVLERLDVLREAKASEPWETSARLNVRPSSIIAAADEADRDWAQQPTSSVSRADDSL